MIEKINDFMFNAPNWKVAIITFAFGFCFINSLFLGLEYLFGSNVDMPLIKRTMLVASILGLGMVGMILLFIQMVNESEQFWTKAKEVEKLIDDAETKQEISDIIYDELTELRKMSMGRPHNYEVIKLITVAATKVKYLK
jgi:hypothetical protein